MTVADLVILNKMDLATPTNIRQVREDLSYAAPQARIIETTHAQVPLDVLFDRGGADHDRLTSKAHSQHLTAHGYQSWSWSADRPLDAERFRAFVRAIPTAVYRAKGIVHLADTPGQAWVFQLVGPRASLEPAESLPAMPQSRVVCIGRYGSVDYDALRQQLDRCCTTDDDIATQLQYSRVFGAKEPSHP
jgi:G3E family GTPase